MRMSKLYMFLHMLFLYRWRPEEGRYLVSSSTIFHFIFFVAVVKIFFHTIYSAHVFPSHSSSQIHFICWDRFSHSTWNSKVQLDRMSSRSLMFCLHGLRLRSLKHTALLILTVGIQTQVLEQVQQALEPTESSLWPLKPEPFNRLQCQDSSPFLF